MSYLQLAHNERDPKTARTHRGVPVRRHHLGDRPRAGQPHRPADHAGVLPRAGQGWSGPCRSTSCGSPTHGRFQGRIRPQPRTRRPASSPRRRSDPCHRTSADPPGAAGRLLHRVCTAYEEKLLISSASGSPSRPSSWCARRTDCGARPDMALEFDLQQDQEELACRYRRRGWSRVRTRLGSTASTRPTGRGARCAGSSTSIS